MSESTRSDEREPVAPKHALHRTLLRRPVDGAVPVRALLARYREADGAESAR